MAWFMRAALAALLLAVIVQPHLIRGHFGPIPEATAQSTISIVAFVLAYGVVLLHRREIRRRELRANRFEGEVHHARTQLMDAYTYIGSANRRVSLLEQLTSGFLAHAGGSRRERKQLFHDLLTIAVTSVAKTDWGVLRCIATEHLRTVYECTTIVTSGAVPPAHISNRAILAIDQDGSRGKDRATAFTVFGSSDRTATVRAVLILPSLPAITETEQTILRAVVDQAQLFHRYLAPVDE